jgi:hypothetical protein
MHGQNRGTCPDWCIADHDAEDDGGRRHHRSATTVVPGIAREAAPPHDTRAVEVLIEVHCDDGDPLIAVYIGDGIDGIDLAVETAQRLVHRLTEVLRGVGAG